MRKARLFTRMFALLAVLLVVSAFIALDYIELPVSTEEKVVKDLSLPTEEQKKDVITVPVLSPDRG
jgi:biopolymer transport protein ExbD